MPKKKTTTKITLTVECEIDNMDISDTETLEGDLVGEFVKVKSGVYENLLMGNIAEIKVTK